MNQPSDNLHPDYEAARRIVFVMASVAAILGLPLQSSPETLLQSAMERPEAVTPDQFRVIYQMRTREAA